MVGWTGRTAGVDELSCLGGLPMALYHSVMMCFALLRMYVAALEISAVTFDHVSSSP